MNKSKHVQLKQILIPKDNKSHKFENAQRKHKKRVSLFITTKKLGFHIVHRLNAKAQAQNPSSKLHLIQHKFQSPLFNILHNRL